MDGGREIASWPHCPRCPIAPLTPKNDDWQGRQPASAGGDADGWVSRRTDELDELDGLDELHELDKLHKLGSGKLDGLDVFGNGPGRQALKAALRRGPADGPPASSPRMVCLLDIARRGAVAI